MRERLESWSYYLGAVGIALWVAATILFFLRQPTERIIPLVGIGVVCLALFAFAKRDEVLDWLRGRAVYYGMTSLVMTLFFIGIVGTVNFLGVRYNQRLDLTANKTNTLADQTIKALKDLKEPVTAMAFYSPETRGNVEDRLRDYARQTDKFTYKFVDPFAEPQLAQEYKVQFDGMVVLERGARRENVFTADESGLTNALLKIVQDKQPTIYFSTGHGEHTPDDSGDNGYSIVRTGLEAYNYRTALLDLKTVTETLPADISALVIAGPRVPFEPREANLVQDYLEKGGRALIMVDPQSDAGLDAVLEAWGLRLRKDAVVDPRLGLVGNAQIPLVNTYKTHEIINEMGGLSTFLPGVRSIQPTEKTVPGRRPNPLFASSDASWGETNFDSLKSQNPQFDSTADAKGPLDLAYAVESFGESKGRLVVIGNSSFVANGPLTARITVGGQQARIQSGNGLLFVNAVHWLAQQENLIAIPPKPSDQSSLLLTGEQLLFIAISSAIMLPAAILIIGALIWLKRR
jgi:ABC-type uncharacterized transport system involved in gliding motility auxiliary subunit